MYIVQVQIHVRVYVCMYDKSGKPVLYKYTVYSKIYIHSTFGHAREQTSANNNTTYQLAAGDIQYYSVTLDGSPVAPNFCECFRIWRGDGLG